MGRRSHFCALLLAVAVAAAKLVCQDRSKSSAADGDRIVVCYEDV